MKKKRDVLPAGKASARHSGAGRNPVAARSARNEKVGENLGEQKWSIGSLLRPRSEKASPAQFPELPYVGLEHVESHTTKLLGTVPASEMRSTAKRFYGGDVLYSRLRPYLNKVWRADRDGLCSAEFIVLPGNEKMDANFLRYRLNSADFVAFANSLNAGDRPRVDFDQISCFELPRFDLATQKAAVAEIEKQFTRLDAGVTALRRVQANLKRYRAAVLKAACEGHLVPTEAELAKAEGRAYETGEQLLARVGIAASVQTKRRAGRLWGSGHVPDLTKEEQGALPDGWAWTKVRQIGFDPEGAVQVGPMSMKSSDFTDEGVPVLNVGCVQWDRFVESKLDHLPVAKASEFERYQIEAGDVLFTRSGTVGRCAVAQLHQKGWLMTFHLLRARPNPQKCLPTFLRTVFEGAAHIRRQTKAASVGSTRAGFNTNLLANLAVPLPPLAEQVRIVAEVERRLSVIKELEATIAVNLRRGIRLRQAVLQRAFTGNNPIPSKGRGS